MLKLLTVQMAKLTAKHPVAAHPVADKLPVAGRHPAEAPAEGRAPV